MAVIEMNYADSLRKAEQLEGLARELRAIATQDIEKIQANINGTWQGSAAELYKRRVNTFAQQIVSQAKKLESTAGSLRFAAETYKRIEESANSIFGG